MSARSAAATDFSSWRSQARALLAGRVPPEDVSWSHATNASLFDAPPAPRTPSQARIPRELASLFERAACHNDPARWALMYRILWRVTHHERSLLSDAADEDIVRLKRMAKAVDREVHHMHAFVRFDETKGPDNATVFEAWFEPEHDVLRLAAPFFRDRFASMRWVISTPRGFATWDGQELRFTDAPMLAPNRAEDAKAGLWRTYYENIFNPARLNTEAMRQHMPKRYWKNMPETRTLCQLERPRVVLAPPVEAPRWASRVQFAAEEAVGVQACRRCPLWENATQAVAGEGPERAAIMLVGEQPGDEEDLKGRAFVGPAGQVLDRALAAAGIERGAVHVTNAVKHFKWEPRGKRRIHKTPAQREIEACGVWLEREVKAVAPRVIVALGATAAFALTGRKVAIGSQRGTPIERTGGGSIVVTYHPSAVLRAQEGGDALFSALRDDLLAAARLAG